MLIELNRFLTTAEVVKEYRVPEFIVDEILPNLPVVAIAPDGTQFHLEKDMDEFLSVYFGQSRKTLLPQQDQFEETKLNEAERNIMEALGDSVLKGSELAAPAGYPFNSNFKSTLASLVKRGLLVNERPGYRKRKSGLSQS